MLRNTAFLADVPACRTVTRPGRAVVIRSALCTPRLRPKAFPGHGSKCGTASARVFFLVRLLLLRACRALRG